MSPLLFPGYNIDILNNASKASFDALYYDLLYGTLFPKLVNLGEKRELCP
ncbi:hypothetical protein J43TS9_43440 [Paenibacillus cineris]|nr:hypothetical protein J43TS9_43440 [Paenibacillus cineris]